MARFLEGENSGSNIGTEVKKILKGRKVRVASAFLGTGSEELVPAGARLICDIGMGGTNPAALKALLKKLGGNLRFIPGLHAKVYLSDKGCAIGSSNLSNNGIGFLNQALLLEAAIYLDAETDASKDAASWFETLWIRSQKVGSEEIKIAEARWKRQRGVPLGRHGYKNFQAALIDTNSAARNFNYILTREELPKGIESFIEEQGSALYGRYEKTEIELDFFHDLVRPEAFDEDPQQYYVSLHRDDKGSLGALTLRFLENCLVPEENGGGVLSTFAIIPWESSLGCSDPTGNNGIAELIRNTDAEYCGRRLTASEFLEALGWS